MKTYEATGKNYEEALQNGLNALHATISDVTVETLEEGSKGLFGFFGSKPFSRANELLMAAGADTVDWTLPA